SSGLSVPDGSRHRRRVSGAADLSSLKQGHLTRQNSLESNLTLPAMTATGQISNVAQGSSRRDSHSPRNSLSEEYSQTLITNTEADGDPLDQLRKILQKEPKERTDEDVDVMVAYFENYRIMSEDIDIYSGKSTFRAFIQETRYRKYLPHKHIFTQGELGDEFYFILTGKVSVLVNDDDDNNNDNNDDDKEKKKQNGKAQAQHGQSSENEAKTQDKLGPATNHMLL
ncbi:cyclic nucleotide-binding domain containing protein, partial [Reticulomyxa filosa]